MCSSDSCVLCDDIKLMSSWQEHLSRTSRILPTRLLDLWPSLEDTHFLCLWKLVLDQLHLLTSCLSIGIFSKSINSSSKLSIYRCLNTHCPSPQSASRTLGVIKVSLLIQEGGWKMWSHSVWNRNWFINKLQVFLLTKKKNIGEDVGKEEPFFTVSGSVY